MWPSPPFSNDCFFLLLLVVVVRVHRHRDLGHLGSQLIVRGRIDFTELRRGKRDTPVRIDDDHGPTLDHSVAPSTDAEGLRGVPVGVTAEQHGEIIVRCPRGQRLRRVIAYGEDGNATPVSEYACVLITVRFHLNCSARRPRSEEKRYYHHLSP